MRLVTLLLLLSPLIVCAFSARAVVVVAADIPPYVIRAHSGLKATWPYSSCGTSTSWLCQASA